jgi:hypothetical protein
VITRIRYDTCHHDMSIPARRLSTCWLASHDGTRALVSALTMRCEAELHWCCLWHASDMSCGVVSDILREVRLAAQIGNIHFDELERVDTVRTQDRADQADGVVEKGRSG